jgi:hypothetical protein
MKSARHAPAGRPVEKLGGTTDRPRPNKGTGAISFARDREHGTRTKEERAVSRDVIGGNSLSMIILRVWMWLVPFVMLLGAVVFGAIAVNDGNWALVAVMIVIGVTAIGLMYFHYWVMYRFGKDAGK